ncbi:Transferrin receptor-like, ESAG6-like [Trypanosoma congolense IL3000]|uniref:Transferrin receptor-like, ESAG6-like n=1 Tax=Trypanosoma congolense (strain IL3000) TaxID=1068625 RepID=F9WGG9_TRYCI|nr:Transferrin receptor-like, ESAG6-like [Trypanosoma congolense IL3000]
MLQAMKALGLLLMMHVFCSVVSCALSYYPKALHTETGGSICSLSRKLKEVIPWTQEQLDVLKKTRDAYASKFLDWQLHFHGSSECELNQSILEDIRTDLEKVNEEIKTLSGKAIRAGALAAKSAGRLDEFVTVFARARGDGPTFYEKSSFCFGYKGHPATRADLHDCFPEGTRFDIGEANLAKIPESTANKEEPNLTGVIENVNHSAVEAHFRKIHWEDIHADCNLIKGSSTGIVGSVNLGNPLWWGGGILTLGNNFNGVLERTKFNAGDIADASKGRETRALWTASPHTIPHIKKTLAAFQAFKDSAEKITQKFNEIDNIEKQIEPCLSNETMEQGPTQSCFQNAVNLNAELQAANALLARYHKEKGPLPSGSALILHPSVVKVWCLIAALLYSSFKLKIQPSTQ